MKKFSSILLALCLLLSLCACSQFKPVQDLTKDTDPTTAPTTVPTESTKPTEPADPITPILYKVTDDAGHTAWLFGSIHVGYEYFYPLPDYVTSAYENSDALAVEFDVVAFTEDMAAQTEALMQLVYLDGTMIGDHIPEELYTEAVAVLEECGLYMSALDLYYPALWSNFIDAAQFESWGVDSELGVDMYFINNAHETEKQIQDIESGQFQYGMMSEFSDELQIELLEGSLDNYRHTDEGKAEIEELVQAWAYGNEEKIVELLNEEGKFETEEEALLYAEYNNAMITERNENMADFAEEALSSGKEVFICVGTAHVVGPGAMADLLTQRGYTVERIFS